MGPSNCDWHTQLPAQGSRSPIRLACTRASPCSSLPAIRSPSVIQRRTGPRRLYQASSTYTHKNIKPSLARELYGPCQQSALQRPSCRQSRNDKIAFLIPPPTEHLARTADDLITPLHRGLPADQSRLAAAHSETAKGSAESTGKSRPKQNKAAGLGHSRRRRGSTIADHRHVIQVER